VLWFDTYCQAHNLQPSPDAPLDLLAIAIEKTPASMEELLDAAGKILFPDP